MLIAIFAILAIVMVAGSFHPKASDNPMVRVGSWCFAAVFALIAISFVISG